MLFHIIAAIASVAFISQGALAALTPDQVVTNIGIVTTLSTNANTELLDISKDSGVDAVTTAAQKLSSNIDTINKYLGGYPPAQYTTPPFTDGEAQPIVDALEYFVNAQKVFTSTLNDKHFIFAQFGLTSPIVTELRTLDNVIDEFAQSMYKLIPTRMADVTEDNDELYRVVGGTITIYGQLCTPSPLYPDVRPVCV